MKKNKQSIVFNLYHLSCRLLLPILLFFLIGCGGTWVDSPGNFKRVFGFNKPDDVKVLHSYYWKSPHFFTEYRYFIQIQASQKFLEGLTSPKYVTKSKKSPDEELLNSFGNDHPKWFLPKPLNKYEMWIPVDKSVYRIFRDLEDGTLFLCDEQL